MANAYTPLVKEAPKYECKTLSLAKTPSVAK